MLLKLLVEFIMPGEAGSNREILWVMRPQLAEALEALGWVPKAAAGSVRTGPAAEHRAQSRPA